MMFSLIVFLLLVAAVQSPTPEDVQLSLGLHIAGIMYILFLSVICIALVCIVLVLIEHYQQTSNSHAMKNRMVKRRLPKLKRTLSPRMMRLIREKIAADTIIAYFIKNYVNNTLSRQTSERNLEHILWLMINAAIKYRHTDLVAALLYDPRVSDDNRAAWIPHPLLHGIYVGDVDLLDVLLVGGYSPLKRSKVPRACDKDVGAWCDWDWRTKGISAVEYACLLNRSEMVARLVAYETFEDDEGACGSQCNSWGKNRKTSLHVVLDMDKNYALLKRKFVLPEIVKALIDEGACVHCRNIDSLTPLGLFMRKIEEIFDEDFGGGLIVGAEGRRDILETVRILLEAGSETSRADGTTFLYTLNKLINTFLQYNTYNISTTHNKDFNLLAEIFQLLVAHSTGEDSASEFRLFGAEVLMNAREITDCHQMMNVAVVHSAILDSLANMFSALMLRRPGSVSELWEFNLRVFSRECNEHCFVDAFHTLVKYSSEPGRSSVFLDRFVNAMTTAEIHLLRELLAIRRRHYPEGNSEQFANESLVERSIENALNFLKRTELPRSLCHLSRQAVISVIEYPLQDALTLPLPKTMIQYILTND